MVPILFVFGLVVSEPATTDPSVEDILALLSNLNDQTDTVLSINLRSTSGSVWIYEVQNSSGARFIVNENGDVLETVGSGYGDSRRQIERDAAARAVSEGRLPALAAVVTDLYNTRPDAVILRAKIEYDHGRYETEITYLPDPGATVPEHREWEW